MSFARLNICSFYIALLAVSLPAAAAWGCDPCALYSASRMQGSSKGALTLFLNEQFTSYDKTTLMNDDSAAKQQELVRSFNITQLGIAYGFSDRFSAQLNIPIIVRRAEQVSVGSGTETDVGIGDVSLMGDFTLLDTGGENWSGLFSLAAGLKIPSGDTGVLRDIKEQSGSDVQTDQEGDNDEGDDHDESDHDNHNDHSHHPGFTLKHHPGVPSSTGGRTLAFGSGSFDYIFAANIFSRYERALFLGSAQYSLRTEGDFNYEFADEVIWSVSPGYYFFLEHDFAFAATVDLRGEHKASDHLGGHPVSGSAFSNLYIGPRLIANFNKNCSAEIAVHFLAGDYKESSSVTPDLRILFSLAHRFGSNS